MDSRDEKPLFTRGRSLRFRPKSRALTNSGSETESGMTFSICHFRVPFSACRVFGSKAKSASDKYDKKTIFHQN